MLPFTLSAPTKLANILSVNSALERTISAIASSNGITVPSITASNIVLSSTPPDLGDLVQQLSYPRVALYCSHFENSHLEKFRCLSGAVSVVADIWSSGNLMSDAESWVHFYVEAFTTLIQENIGDWGDGFCYPGTFDVQMQPPKRGGFGFVQMARITCHVFISRN